MADKTEGQQQQQQAELELPPEVDAFLKGKSKYKHPYGDWKPVVKTEALKRSALSSASHSYLLFLSTGKSSENNLIYPLIIGMYRRISLS